LNPFLAACIRPLDQFKGIHCGAALFAQPRPKGRERGQITPILKEIPGYSHFGIND